MHTNQFAWYETGGTEVLQYEVQWDTVRGFIAADPAIGSRRSWEDAGFTNLDDGADVDPFKSANTIQFTFPAGALTDGQTYWWRVRSRRSDTLALSAWSTPRTFTVDTAQTVFSEWHQTTSQQFVNDTLTDAVTGLESPTLHVIDSGAADAYDIDAVDLDGDGDTDVVTAARTPISSPGTRTTGRHLRLDPARHRQRRDQRRRRLGHRRGGRRRRRRHRRGDLGELLRSVRLVRERRVDPPVWTLRVIDSGRPTPTPPATSTRWTSTATATPTW